jgi:hypothetical protein
LDGRSPFIWAGAGETKKAVLGVRVFRDLIRIDDGGYIRGVV